MSIDAGTAVAPPRSAPPPPVRRRPVLRVVEAEAIRYRRAWRASLSVAILTPTLFLLAMGLGLGSLVDDAGRADLGGVSYAAFIAPGLVAATAMRIASSEGSFPVLHGIIWGKTYFATLATPVSVVELTAGHLLWIAIRVATSSAVILAVVAAFGEVGSPLAVLAAPAAVLTGAAFAGPMTAYTAGLRTAHGVAGVERFVIMPLFLFSGTFFPVEQLPDWMEPIAHVTPLWHGVDLCRDLMQGDVPVVATAGHVGYLAAWVVIGSVLAARRLAARLVV